MKRILLLFLSLALPLYAGNVTNLPFNASMTSTDYFYTVHYSNGVAVSRNVTVADLGAQIFNDGRATNNTALPIPLNAYWLLNNRRTAPVVGYDSWVSYGDSKSTEAGVSNAIFAITNANLTAYYPEFFTSVNDGWQGLRVGGHLQATNSFLNNSLSNICRIAKSAGVKLIVYTEPNDVTDDGHTGTGTNNIEVDAVDFANWGLDGVRFDMTPAADDQVKLVWANRMVAAFTAAVTNSRPLYFVSKGWQATNAALLSGVPGNYSLLAGGDWPAEADYPWGRLAHFLVYVDSNKFHTALSPGVYLGSTDAINNNGFEAQNYTIFSGFAMFNWPILSSYVEGGVSMAVLTNLYAIRVHHDTAYTAQMISSNASQEIFSRKLSDGTLAVWMLNRTTNTTQSVGASFAQFGYPVSTMNVHDIWLNLDYAAAGGVTNSLTNAQSAFLLLSPLPSPNVVQVVHPQDFMLQTAATVDYTGSTPVFAPNVRLPTNATWACGFWCPRWPTNAVVQVLYQWSGTTPLTYTNRVLGQVFDPVTGRGSGTTRTYRLSLTNHLQWITFTNEWVNNGAFAVSGEPRTLVIDNLNSTPTNITDNIRILEAVITFGAGYDSTKQ